MLTKKPRLATEWFPPAILIGLIGGIFLLFYHRTYLKVQRSQMKIWGDWLERLADEQAFLFRLIRLIRFAIASPSVCAIQNKPLSLVVKAMGHSIAVHSKIYHAFLTEADMLAGWYQ